MHGKTSSVARQPEPRRPRRGSMEVSGSTEASLTAIDWMSTRSTNHPAPCIRAAVSSSSYPSLCQQLMARLCQRLIPRLPYGSSGTSIQSTKHRAPWASEPLPATHLVRNSSCPQLIMSTTHHVRNSSCPQLIMSATHHVRAVVISCPATSYRPGFMLWGLGFGV